ncbi:nucleotidyltransferase family protein [Phenylobacterium sp.]|uniref:nucleotidyltransferase family protein n=1 Tax=Phenylobacterium sp. TaxID=1871053 RepID=UPI0025D1831F|nr:nucleotidyltransferase family protein [Phenylobacterium sp.]
MSRPKTAMVMAAGLGTRMRPLSNDRPKALVEVAGKPLLAYVIDPLVAAGVERIVVNVHAHPDQIEAYLAGRRDAEFLISDERERLLETGGGVKHARALLGDDPIFRCNSDYVWVKPGEPAMEALVREWDPARMDALVTVIPKDRTLGFDTPGDFYQDAEGRLTHRGERPSAPLHAFGVEIIDPRTIYADPREAFSLRDVWFRSADKGRLFGLQLDGLWMQVGDPAARDVAEAQLRARVS